MTDDALDVVEVSVRRCLGAHQDVLGVENVKRRILL